MSSSTIIPIFDPQGTLRQIPQDQMRDALANGGKVGVKMTGPDGKTRWVPHDQVQDALSNGGKLIPINQQSKGFDESRPIMANILDWSSPVLNKPVGGQWAQNKLQQATQMEQEEANKAMGPESAGALPPIRLGHQLMSLTAGAARVPYGILSMTPAEAGLTAASTASGNPEVAGAYWGTKAVGNLSGVGREGPGSVRQVIQRPGDPEAWGSMLSDASMMFGSMSGMPNRPAGMAPFRGSGIQPVEPPPGVWKAPQPEGGGVIQRGVRSMLGMGKEPTLKVGRQELAKHAEATTKVNEANAAAQTAYQDKVADVAAKQAERNREVNLKNQQAQADYWNTRRTVEEKNEIAHAEHQKAVAEVEARNKASEAAVGERAALDKKITENSAALGQQVRELEARVRAEGSAKYDAINQAVAGDSVPADTLAQSVRHAQQKIIAGTPESIKQFNEILNTGEAQEVSTSVGAAVPGTALYDTLVREGAIEPSGTMGWRDLQGLYTELGDKMSRGNLPGDVYNALKYVRNAIGEQMGKMAERHGMADAWNDARAHWQQYRDTFHDMTPVSQGGSPIARVLRADDPGFIAQPILGKASTRAVQMLKAYDPAVAAQAAQIAADNARMNALPKKAVVKPTPKLTGVSTVPEPPEPKVAEALKPPEPPVTKPIPEPPNLVEATRQAREARLDMYINRLRSPVALAWEVPGIIMGAVGSLWHPSALSASVFMGGEFATRQAIARIMESPKAVEWLTKPTPQDIAQLNTLGPEARSALQQAFTDTMVKHHIPPSPALRSFLTKAQLRTTMAAVGASQGAQPPSTPEGVMLAMKNGQLTNDEGNRLLQRMKGKGSVVRPIAPPP